MPSQVYIRELSLADEKKFLQAMHDSRELHQELVCPPKTHDEFVQYYQRYQQSNQKSFVVCNFDCAIVGIYNISEIVYGAFQSAFLGYYAVNGYQGQGLMSAGLKLVLEHYFTELKLHRLEANIQPQLL